MICPNCHCDRPEFARIRIEIVDKKSREIIEISYGEALCIDCINKRYKGRKKLRIYV